jgi:flagellar protein FliO/FliZ
LSAPLFAAPAASSAHSTGGGLAEVTLALLAVVALIAGLAWLAKRMRGFGAVGGGRDRIQVLSNQVLGPKERCVLIRIGETDILIGVAQGQVNPLHVFPAGANTEAPAAPPASGPKLPNFKELLMRSLGK